MPAVEERVTERYGQVALTGEPIRFEEYVSALDSWFDCYASRVGGAGSKTVAVVFDDITERKRREEHQALRLELGDALRPLQDPAAIQEAAMRVLGSHLGVSRAYYTEASPDGDTLLTRTGYFKDVPSLVGSMKFSEFDVNMRRTYVAGKTVVVNDVLVDAELSETAKAAFESIQFRAGIGVPLVKEERLLAIVTVHQATPRKWTEEEVALLEEVAERTWAAVERARAERALRESEARLRALVENLPGAAVFVVDRGLRYLVAEGEALAAAGFAAEDFVGRTIAEAVPPELAALLEATYRKALAGEGFEHEHAAAHGRTYISRGVPLAGEGGEVYAALAVSYDITDRRRAEERLRESEERLRLVVESVEDYAIFTIDTRGLVTSWNEGARRLKGYTAEEVVGRSLALFYTGEGAAAGKPASEMAAALREGRSEDESWRVRKDGSRFWVNEVMTPLYAADGATLLGFTKVSRDLTARKGMEDALRRAHDELEERVSERTAELQRMTGELLGEVKERGAAEGRVRELLRRMVTVQEEERRRVARELHDTLGQQLAALRWSIEHLMSKTDGGGGEGVAEEAGRMRAIFERLNADVDFLAWELRPAALDALGLDAALESLVGEWGKHFGVEADYHGFGGGTSSPPPLPPEVEANIYRILQEALQNVHKHAGAGRVGVVLERRGGALVLIVEDDGRGYDADGEASSAGRGGGTKGMGVTNMKERAALMGGALEVESAPGAGTTVFVRVPIKAGPPEEQQESTP